MPPVTFFSLDSPQLLGAIELGAFISVFLFGAIVVQGHFYLTHCKNDSKILVSFVCFVLALEAAHTAAAIQIVWSGTVAVATSYSTCEASLFETVITISVQAYYFHRIGQLSSKTWLSLLGWFVTTVSFGVGLFTNYQSFILEAVQWQLEWGWLVKVSFAGIAAVDIFITGLLCYYLKRASAPAIKVPLMKSTAELVNRLIIWTVETGMLTSITSIAVLICFQMMDSNWIWYGLYLPMGKLYSNSLLASLNARASHRKMLGMVQMLSDAGSLPLQTRTISTQSSRSPSIHMSGRVHFDSTSTLPSTVTTHFGPERPAGHRTRRSTVVSFSSDVIEGWAV